MKTGLTLGKYAPFHKGHQYLISTALEEMDHVIAVVYAATKTTKIPATVRAGWINETVPEVEIIIALDGPQETGYTDEIIEKQNSYLLGLLAGRKIDAFYSSEPYGETVSRAFGCANRLVDQERSRWPVSATMIRNNPRKMKDFVPPCVFNTLKPKIYFTGAPSTGKTTLARYCSARFGGAYCGEYGCDYWFMFQKDHRLTMEDLVAIADGHNEWENIACRSDFSMSFIDTCNLTTLAYAHYYFGRASKELERIFRDNLWKYGHIFLCGDEIPFLDTWDRSGPDSRGLLQAINIKLLEEYKIPYTVLAGSVEDRANTVKKHVGENCLCQIY